jgi:uncharacterized protein (TIGR02118 family)
VRRPVKNPKASWRPRMNDPTLAMAIRPFGDDFAFKGDRIRTVFGLAHLTQCGEYIPKGVAIAASLLKCDQDRIASTQKEDAPKARRGAPMIKSASLLVRKEGITHEEFVRHWRNIHAPLAHDCPGISRYTLTIIKSSSTRTDGVGGLDVEVDGIAELWFENQAARDQFAASPATERLLADGATFIGREIDFVAEEIVIIPRKDMTTPVEK